MDPRLTYTRTAIALHWTLALLIGGTFVLGIYMSNLPMSPARLKYFNWHKWAGVTILVLSTARLLWRLTHRPPADLPMPRWQRRAAHAVHLAMYVLCLAVPLVGWAYSSATGFPVVWFGVLQLPDLVPADRVLADTLKLVHGTLAGVLAAAVLVHLLAVAKHLVVNRDGLLHRMLPLRG